MSTSITLQADLTIKPFPPGTVRITIPSGTVLAFLDAPNLNAVAEQLWAMSPAGMQANLSQLERTVTAGGAEGSFDGIDNGNSVFITYGPGGRRILHDYGVSASPSASVSLSPSASSSRSPSSSTSLSPSSSASRSLSRSPSAS